jgi:hypothetical protein
MLNLFAKKKDRLVRHFDARPGAINVDAMDERGHIRQNFQRCLDGEAEEY